MQRRRQAQQPKRLAHRRIVLQSSAQNVEIVISAVRHRKTDEQAASRWQHVACRLPGGQALAASAAAERAGSATLRC